MTDKNSGSILGFGEVLLRLSSAAGARLVNSSSLSVHCGGAEANVCAMLAQLGHEAEMVTVLPRSALGDLCEAELRRTGVKTGRSRRADGRLGLYFMEADAGGRGTILYDRHHSAFAEHADEVDWSPIVATARWLHVSGINLAIGGKPARAALAAVEAARAAGATVSFDVNHRASLWEARKEQDVALVRRMAAMADVLFASPPDLSRLLARELPHETEDDRRRAAETALHELQRPSIIACTLRWFGDDGQRLSARIDSKESGLETGRAAVGPVIDRIGSGDAFAAGVIDGLVRMVSLKACACNGLAAAVLKHAIAGDRWIGTRADLERFDPFVAGDVQR